MTDKIVEISQRILRLWNGAHAAGLTIEPLSREAMAVTVMVCAEAVATPEFRCMAEVVLQESHAAKIGTVRTWSSGAHDTGAHGSDPLRALEDLEAGLRLALKSEVERWQGSLDAAKRAIEAAGKLLEST